MRTVQAVQVAMPAGKRHAALTPVAWVVNVEMDLAEWVSAGRNLGTMGRCGKWWIGDWIRYGNTKFGERYVRAAAITGYDTQSLMNMVWVASRFEISRRREILSWSHHESVASLERDEQERWLDQASEKRLSVADLRLELRVARKLLRAQEPGENDDLDSTADEVLVCPNCGQGMPIGDYWRQVEQTGAHLS